MSQDKTNPLQVNSAVSTDVELAAMVSKVTRPSVGQTVSRDQRGNRKVLPPDVSSLHSQLTNRAKGNQDAQSILQLLPDLELAVQILTSSILSPSDMLSVELNFTAAPDIFTSELSSSLTDTIRGYLEEDCQIKKELPVMLRDIIAEKGSYPVAVIPENVIDEIINGAKYNVSKESLNLFVKSDGITPRSAGILGPGIEAYGTPRARPRLSLEALSAAVESDFETRVVLDNASSNVLLDEYLSVTDNIMVLKFSGLFNAVRRKQVRTSVSATTHSFSLEALNKSGKSNQISDHLIENALYSNRRFSQDQVTSLKKQHELTRNSVGKPLVMKLPSESVLPVYVPGDTKKHIGYFVMVDDEGNPVSSDIQDNFYSTAQGGFGSSNRTSLSSNLIQRVSVNLGSSDNVFDPKKRVHLDYIAKVYADMVERDLIARVKNGVHSSSVKIAQSEEVYRLMLSRTLQHKYTQLLYIPIDYMTYMAFKYNSSGIGKSLLDDNSAINTLRTVLMFSNVLGAVKNSIGRTKVSVVIPEEDTDPVKTLEDAQEEIVRSRQLGLPFGGGWNPNDIMDFLQRAGFEWAVSGGNLPDIKFDFESVSSNYPKADTELDDGLRKHSIMGMGLSPEMVDNGLNSEFATVVTQNNILLTKRIVQWQELFNPHLSDHCRKLLIYSEGIIKELYEKIKENVDSIKLELADDEKSLVEKFGQEEVNHFKIGKALNEFIAKFTISLPSPPSVSLERQTELVRSYSEFLDQALDVAYINSNIVAEAMSGSVDNIKAQIKAFYMRQFMADKGIGVELGRLLATNEAGGPQIELFKEVASHAEALTRSCVASVAALVPINAAAQSDLDKMGTDGQSNASGSSDSSSSDDSGGDEFGDMSGGADFEEPQGDDSSTGSEGESGDQPQEGEESPSTPDL